MLTSIFRPFFFCCLQRLAIFLDYRATTAGRQCRNSLDMRSLTYIRHYPLLCLQPLAAYLLFVQVQHPSFRLDRTVDSHRPIFPYRANHSLSPAITFRIDNSFSASLSFFFSPHSTSPLLHPIYRIFIFSVFFLRISAQKKQHPLLDAVSFLVQFFLSIFYAY